MLLNTEGELMPFLGVQRDTGVRLRSQQMLWWREKRGTATVRSLLWQQGILSTPSLAVYLVKLY